MSAESEKLTFPSHGEDRRLHTPLELSIAIFYVARSGDYGLNNGDNNFDAPAVREARKRLVEAGLLKPETFGDLNYRATDGLRLYVEELCKVGWPMQKWVMPKHEAS